MTAATPGNPPGRQAGAADVIVVGAGLAGLEVARRLAAAGGAGRILVVEAGPDAGREHYRWADEPARADARWLDPAADPHLWQPYRRTDAGYGGIAGLRRRLGGRSLYWGGVALPIEPWALAGSWPDSVVADLTGSWRGGPPLYESVAAQLRQWAGSPAGAAQPSHPLVGREFAEAPKAVRQADQGGRWRAYSPLDDWPDSVELACDSHAVAVQVEAGRVTGLLVERAGERQLLGAGRVVLAAGTVESSRLVLQALHQVDGSAPVELPGLADKVAQGFMAAFDPAQAPPSVKAFAESGRLFVSRADAELRSSVFLRCYLNEHGLLIVDCYCMGEQLPGRAGRVWCEPGAQLPWPTSVAGGLSPADEQLVLAQRRELRRIHRELCLEAGTGGAEPAFESAFGSPDLAERLGAGAAMTTAGSTATYSFPIGSEQHESGTLPLGGALLDEHARVRAVAGLSVAGPATFPRSGAANPALTILALAARLAADLAEELADGAPDGSTGRGPGTC
ncbi:GMC oxidoreductase [Kitasatospora viridis]|uniref:GMC oxidoreductase n=1 Tax=Kitasatospora viridis TaxID=281105 RepID=UPI0014780AA7|nr:GMC oxidoreductase [Kitasatospora viridis]